jgi:hypothetical protein
VLSGHPDYNDSNEAQNVDDIVDGFVWHGANPLQVIVG